LSLVLDPSLALSWCFEDERTAEADARLDQVVDWGAVVPSLWRLEVANGFQTAIRRKRIDAAFRDAALAMMEITVDSDTDANAWTTTAIVRSLQAHRLQRGLSGVGAAKKTAARLARPAIMPCGQFSRFDRVGIHGWMM
jgi:hypothetical protein